MVSYLIHLSRLGFSLTCPALKIPCVGYYDDCGMVLPECLIKMALDVIATFNNALLIISREKKSEFGAPVEFLGLTVSFRNGGSYVSASFLLADEPIRKLVGTIRELADQ